MSEIYILAEHSIQALRTNIIVSYVREDMVSFQAIGLLLLGN
jgi:hypothetical protein